jgi:Domain of unknown function (DUF4383)
MLRKAAMAVGAVFLLIGILGLIPALTPEAADGSNKLLGIFQVDGTHNLIHILSGLAFLAASQKARWSRLAFQVMGVVYALVTIVGFIVGPGGSVLGLFHTNMADNFLHLVLAAAFLYFGFVYPEDRSDSPV